MWTYLQSICHGQDSKDDDEEYDLTSVVVVYVVVQRNERLHSNEIGRSCHILTFLATDSDLLDLTAQELTVHTPAPMCGRFSIYPRIC